MEFAPVVGPGHRLGSLQLGATIREVFRVLHEDNFTFRSVDLFYNPEVSVGSESLFLDLAGNGVRLIFDPLSQRVTEIIVYDLKKLNLFYGTVPFSGRSASPSFRQIYRLFGPTYPGTFDSSSQTYWLHYPGISFAFPVAREFASLYTDTSTQTELPTVLPDGTEPIAREIRIFPAQIPTLGRENASFHEGMVSFPNFGTDGKKDRDLLLVAALPPLPPTSVYFRPVEVEIGKGAKWAGGSKQMTFFSNAQDVLTELGPPCAIFAKQSNKLGIQRQENNTDGGCCDYFFNYPELGTDILFDVRTHRIKKFIFYTNCPCDNEFNSYAKSNFSISTANGAKITPQSLWNDIVRIMGPSSPPVVYDDLEINSDSNNNNAITTDHPSGIPSPSPPPPPVSAPSPSLFYGYNGVIFRVVKSGALLSVTIYQSPPLEDSGER